ncbi:MAG: hypothetical protein KAR13_21650 [Desulfobulbaceae bacterium]|nr:hypothetical protein [Desulfobulbaceae bacterium]
MNLFKKKYFLLIVGGLIFAQIIFYCFCRTKNLKAYNLENRMLDKRIEQLQPRLRNMQIELAQSKKKIIRISKSLHPSIRNGYEDHEAVLASFLDYLTEMRKKADYSFTVRKERKYVNTPVPFYQTDLNFMFTFIRLSEAESFFSLILEQHTFPLKVTSVDIRWDNGERATCTLEASLLVPEKLQLSNK